LNSTKYKVFLESRADKQLRKLPLEDRERVLARIQKLKEGLLPELDVKKLKGYKDQYRLRVGEFRVLSNFSRSAPLLFMLYCPERRHIRNRASHISRKYRRFLPSWLFAEFLNLSLLLR